MLKLILNLLLLLVAFTLVRRALGRFFGVAETKPPPEQPQQPQQPPQSQSGRHPAIDENAVIEDAEFEELD